MRKTKQKLSIKEEINKFNKFFTAEELFDKIRKKDKRIGIATIYRSLKNLKEKKDLHSYLCNRKTVYSREENNHCHFICQKCKKIKHFEVKTIDFLKEKFKGDICHFQIDVHGICNKCLK